MSNKPLIMSHFERRLQPRCQVISLCLAVSSVDRV